MTRRSDTLASPAEIHPTLDTEDTLDPVVEDPQTSVLASCVPPVGSSPRSDDGEAHLAASRADQWTFAISQLGLDCVVMLDKHGPGPLISAEDIGVGDGIALFLSGALTQLRLPWSSSLAIQLLLRSSDGLS